MKTIDMTKIYQKYKGMWVALEDDEETVIASGETLKETALRAEKKGFKQPIFMQIPKNFTYLVGRIILYFK